MCDGTNLPREQQINELNRFHKKEKAEIGGKQIAFREYKVA